MRTLIAPLNWGLGHASRCVPLIERLLAEGHEVVLGGDGESLTLLRKHFPTLPVLPLAPLNLRYSAGSRQVTAMLRALPHILLSAWRDHRIVANYLRYEQIDQIISDNRFGLYLSNRRSRSNNASGLTSNSAAVSIYITHQLTIALPRPWRWLEPLAARLHRRIISHYDQCWIPDLPDTPGLAGRLSHPAQLPRNAKYIGALSRFNGHTYQPDHTYDVVAVLSGLEPQRTIFEQQIVARWQDSGKQVLIIRGKMQAPPTVTHHKNITFAPWMDDHHLAAYLLGAKNIICRSGYSSLMDMHALGVLNRVEWHPTPGQPEQQYLAQLHLSNHK